MFYDMSLASEFAAGSDYGRESIRILQALLDEKTLLIRRRKLDEILIDSKYEHLSLHEAALKLLEGVAVEPARVNASVLALLMAQVRPPQREAIGSSPKQHLKRRSGHNAREPPLLNFHSGLVALATLPTTSLSALAMYGSRLSVNAPPNVTRSATTATGVATATPTVALTKDPKVSNIFPPRYAAPSAERLT